MRARQKFLPIFICVILLVSFTTTAYADAPGLTSFPDPLDPQSWELQRNMTWDDWNDNPVVDWNEAPIEEGTRVLKGALILVDFLDRQFIVTEEKGSELIGNPVIDAVPEDELVDFWVNFLNTPSEINNYRSINEFWRENSYGKWAVELDGFGPFHLPYNEYEYGLDNGMNQMSGSRNIGKESYELCKTSVPFDDYDFFFVLHSGYDESGVWQELGEMKFLTKEDVTDEYGPSDELLAAIENETDTYGPSTALAQIWDTLGFVPNWSPTRYVPWSSAYAAKGVWSHSSSVKDSVTSKRYTFSVQGENDGMATFAHEFGHIMSLPDNYNNPYGIPLTRSYTGSWETMSRGSFSGPGGPHQRWQIPSTLGSSAPSPHLLNFSMRQGFTDVEDIFTIDRDELATTGPVFADIVARVIPVGEEFGIDGYRGLRVTMDQDYTPLQTLEDDYRAYGTRPYTQYDVEVVDQVGYDSFALDSGVLIEKSKNSGSAPTTWLIDSHPEDINLVDFERPDGTDAMLSLGDMNQLADAAFHAGTGKDVVNENVDEYNRLHFYILNKTYDENGVLSYRVGVRNLDGAGDFTRGLTAEKGKIESATPGNVAVQYINVTNTGESTDIIRLEAKTEGWEVMLLNNIIEVNAGETVEVPVYVQIPKNSKDGKQPNPTKLTFTATSETDAEQSATVDVKVGPGNRLGN